MNRFDYIRPASLEEALVAGARPGAAYLAGGTTLLDLMKVGVAAPALLVDVTRLPGLDAIEETAEGDLRIGAMVRNSDIARAPEIKALFPMLAGALLDPAIGWGGLGLAALLAGLRLIVKPFALRAGGVRREGAGALSWAVVRQSPLAVALGVSVVVSVGDAAPAKLLTVIVLAGVLAELTPLPAAWALRGAPMETPVEPKAAAEGAPESASEQGGAS